MKAIEDTPARLVFTLGIPWFNGSRCVLDKASGVASIETANLFFKKKRDIRLDEIERVDLVEMRNTNGQGTVSAFPQLQLASGDQIALPSFGVASAERAVAKLRDFLGLPG